MTMLRDPLDQTGHRPRPGAIALKQFAASAGNVTLYGGGASCIAVTPLCRIEDETFELMY
jgi:hypothetical protein